MSETRTMTFAALWERSVERHGDRPFLVFDAASDEPRSWTYREFDDLVARRRNTAWRRGPARHDGAPGVEELSRVHRPLAGECSAGGGDGAGRSGVRHPRYREPGAPRDAGCQRDRGRARGRVPRGGRGPGAGGDRRDRNRRRSRAGRAARCWPAAAGGRPRRAGCAGRDVHLRYDLGAEGRAADAGQLRRRRRSNVAGGGTRVGTSLAGDAAALPRERAVLRLRTGDPGRGERRARGRLLRITMGGAGPRVTRDARQSLRRRFG